VLIFIPAGNKFRYGSDADVHETTKTMPAIRIRDKVKSGV
jgi:hypothetical protein